MISSYQAEKKRAMRGRFGKKRLGQKLGRILLETFVSCHHSSRMLVTWHLEHSTHQPGPDRSRDVGLFELAPRRVYLVSLLRTEVPYLLSVALVLISRWTGVTRYAAI